MMNEDLRGLSGLMRDKGFTKPQKFAPGGAVMQANPMMQSAPMMQTPAPTQATQEMQMPQAMAAQPMARAPAGMQMDPDESRSLDMRARQQMQKNDLMGQLLNLVGDDNPEVIKLLRDAPVSELMKAVQEITEANATVTSTSS
tara:strand:+ start:518 stop:946 length:429 start_codon:yes stop_codon:yes gene_type:complete